MDHTHVIRERTHTSNTCATASVVVIFDKRERNERAGANGKTHSATIIVAHRSEQSNAKRRKESNV